MVACKLRPPLGQGKVTESGERTLSHFAIFVTIKLKPGTAEDFRPLIEENAAAAPRDEPDCISFDVLTDEDDPETFFFYEVYTDAEALEKHRDTPHYKKYMDAAGDMIADRSIQRCNLVAANV